MPAKKGELTPIQARMKALRDRAEREGDIKSDSEIEAFERQIKAAQMIGGAVKAAKDQIAKKAQEPEQLFFSFMPTQMTRTSPFFPMSKRQMKDRPIELIQLVKLLSY